MNIDKVFIGYSTHDVDRPANVRKYDIDIVKADLMNQFMTRKGERLMRPNFGSVIWDLLFEPLTQITKDAIISDSKRIVNSDPRVDLVDLIVDEYAYGIVLNFTLNFTPQNVTDSLLITFKKEVDTLNPSSTNDNSEDLN